MHDLYLSCWKYTYRFPELTEIVHCPSLLPSVLVMLLQWGHPCSGLSLTTQALVWIQVNREMALLVWGSAQTRGLLFPPLSNTLRGMRILLHLFWHMTKWEMERFKGNGQVPVPKTCRCHAAATVDDLGEWSKASRLKKFGLSCPKSLARCQKNQDWNVSFPGFPTIYYLAILP